MLDTRLRKRIEWHFYNYSANQKEHDDKVQDIINSGLTAKLTYSGRANTHSNPTESKAVRIEALDYEKSWATVVRNTFDAFRFEPEYNIMVELYIHGKKYRQIFSDGIWENTFWRWRERWLEYAYRWAMEYKLL